MTAENFLYPASVERFNDEFHEREFLHVQRDDPDHYKEVLTSISVNIFLNRHDLPAAGIVLQQNGERISPEHYTRDTGIEHLLFNANAIDKKKLYHYYTAGAHLILKNAQKHIISLGRFYMELQHCFRQPFELDVVLTASSETNSPWQRKEHAFFIIQTEGTQEFRLRNHQREEIHELLLKQGDLLYIPKSYSYAVDLRMRSLQVHVVLKSFSWRGIAETIIAEMSQIAAARASYTDYLFGRSGVEQSFPLQSKMPAYLNIKPSMQAKQISDLYLLAKNRLADYIALETLHPSTRLLMRNRVHACVTIDAASATLIANNKKLQYPVMFFHALQAMQSRSDGFSFSDMHNISESEYLAITRELIEEGILEMYTP